LFSRRGPSRPGRVRGESLCREEGRAAGCQRGQRCARHIIKAAGVSVPGVAGEVTVAFTNETLRGQLGRGFSALGGFSQAGGRPARRSAGEAYGGLRATGAVSGKRLAFPLLHSFAVVREQGARGAPIADRAQRPLIESATTSNASRTSGAQTDEMPQNRLHHPAIHGRGAAHAERRHRR